MCGQTGPTTSTRAWKFELSFNRTRIFPSSFAERVFHILIDLGNVLCSLAGKRGGFLFL